jgi:hypothetical protein
LIGTGEGTIGVVERSPLDRVRSAVDGGGSWLLVGLTVTLLYVAWVGLTLRQASPQDFIHVGRYFVERCHASQVISGYADHYHYDGDIGFDGQVVYFIALDPVRARCYVDNPPYRYTRILLSLLAGTLGLHKPDLVADALIAINLAMIAVGTSVLGAWLRRRGVSAWIAAVYGFYPGIFVTLQRDTTEILAYSLVIVAIFIFDHGPRWRVSMSAACFALAALSRETTLVFAGIWAIGLLLGGEGGPATRIATNWWRSAVFLAIAFGPLLAWKAFLFVWLGSLGLDGVLSPIPFGGVAYHLRHEVEMEQLRTVILPGFLCLAAAVLALAAGVRRVEIWALLINSLLYMTFLGPASFEDLSSSARVTVPIAVAAVLALPYLPARTRAWFWGSAALWLAPMVYWLLLPVQSGLQNLILRRI